MKSDRLYRYTSLPSLLHMLSKRELTLISYNSWPDKNDVHFLREYTKRKKNYGYALCFTHADETFHHWKVYSSSSAGVRITFEREELIAWAEGIIGMRADDVEYKTIEEIRAAPPALERLPFIKRYPYRGEEEVRLLYETDVKMKDPPSFPLELGLIKRITLSPWLHDSLRPAVATVINQVAAPTTIDVSRTTILGNNEWKQTTERIA